MIQKIVLIHKGIFKGHRGRVAQVNGGMATIELTSRPQKISVPLHDLSEIAGDDTSATYSNRNEGGQSVYGHKGGFGGNTAYGGNSVYAGGQTAAYDAGKTPAAFTPMYNQGGAMTPGKGGDWGNQGAATAQYDQHGGKSEYGGAVWG